MRRLVRSAIRRFKVRNETPNTDQVDQSPDRPPNPVLTAVAYNELILAIQATQVYWRPSRQGDETAGPIVTVPLLGRWTWCDRKDAKERVAAKYPEFDKATCARAAKLIESQIGKRNLASYRKASAVDQSGDEWKRYLGDRNA